MLPALPSPLPGLAALRRLLGRLVLPLILLFPLVLAGCGGPGQPPHAVLLDALALQIQLTQGAIAQALELDAPGFPQVSRVRVEEQAAIAIGAAKGLRLAGHFDWRLAGDPIRVDSPFELYLERGERNQSWRLARPTGITAPTSTAGAGSLQEWTTYPLPLPGEAGRG
jgi:hypothetical protein